MVYSIFACKRKWDSIHIPIQYSPLHKSGDSLIFSTILMAISRDHRLLNLHQLVEKEII